MYFLAFLTGGILALITYRCFFKKKPPNQPIDDCPGIPPKSRMTKPGRILEVRPQIKPLKPWNFRKPYF